MASLLDQPCGKDNNTFSSVIKPHQIQIPTICASTQDISLRPSVKSDDVCWDTYTDIYSSKQEELDPLLYRNWLLFFFFLFLIEQIEQAKQDLSRKDSELLAFRTKLETLTNQFSDSKQHVDVLKESLAAKEQRAAILQTEVQALLDQYFLSYTLQATNTC